MSDAWRENPQSVIKDLAKILKNRNTFLKDAIEKISALEDASILPLMGYAGKYVRKSYDKKDVVEYLHTLGSSNDAEDIINWSKIVKGMMTSTQFHIALRRVITEGTDYGTITFDKKKILKIIEAYADVLKVASCPCL